MSKKMSLWKRILPVVAVATLLLSAFALVPSFAPPMPDIYDEVLRMGGVVDAIEEKLDDFQEYNQYWFENVFIPVCSVIVDIEDMVDDALSRLISIEDKIDDIEQKLDKLEIMALTYELGADPGNTEVAAVSVLVTFAGEGVAGLEQGNFETLTHIVPAGGTMLEIVDIQIWPGPWEEGCYDLFVKPPEGEAWKAGSYGIYVKVYYGGNVAGTLVTLVVT